MEATPQTITGFAVPCSICHNLSNRMLLCMRCADFMLCSNCSKTIRHSHNMVLLRKCPHFVSALLRCKPDFAIFLHGYLENIKITASNYPCKLCRAGNVTAGMKSCGNFMPSSGTSNGATWPPHATQNPRTRPVASPIFASNNSTISSAVSNREFALSRCIRTLEHAQRCTDAQCMPERCKNMKRILCHVKMCKKRKANCVICRQLIALCCYHAKNCKERHCSVLLCQNIKRKFYLLNQQSGSGAGAGSAKKV